MASLEDRKSQLLARQSELTARLETIEDALDDPLPKDMEDQAVELDDDEVQVGLGEVSQLELRQIDAALGRIADGAYGECMNCGEPISVARLDAVPHASLCIKCAS